MVLQRRGSRTPLVATIAGLLATYWIVLEPRFFYGNDDLLQFTYANEHGLSFTTLLQNVFQHIAPINRLAHLLVLRLTDVTPIAGFLFSFAGFALLLMAVLWLATEWRLSTARRVAALLAVGLSISVYETGIWFDAAMHIFPALAITIGVLAAHARALRTGARHWHTVSILIFLVGPLTQERPLFALPMIVLMDVLLLWRDDPWSVRLSRLRDLRWPLGIMTGIAIVVAVGYQLFVVVPEATSPTWATTLTTISVSLTWFVLPSLINLHPDFDLYGAGGGPPGGWVSQLAVLLVLAAVCALLVRTSRRNRGPLLFCLATFVLYYGFLKFSPLLNDVTLYFNASRLHNVVYVTVPAIVALAGLDVPALSRSLRHAASGPRRWIKAGVVAALVGALLAGNLFHQNIDNEPAGQARGYIDAVRASEPAWSDPEVTLIPLHAPESIANAWAVPFGRHDSFLSLFAPGWAPSDDTGSPVVVTDNGSVVPVTLPTVAEAERVTEERPACAGSASPSTLDIRLDHWVSGEILFAQITYENREISGGRLIAEDLARSQSNYFPVVFQPGRHTAIFPIDAQELRTLAFDNLNQRSDLCVSQVSIVRPVLPPDSGICYFVDRFGAPGDRTACRSTSPGP